MQQDISNHPTQLFKQVLASGATLADGHLDNLQALLYSFPQCGLLHAIQARSGDAARLNEAAARFSNSATLQKIVQWPDSLPVVSTAQIIIKTAKVKTESPVAEQAIEPVFAGEPVVTAQPEPVAANADTGNYYEVIDEVEMQPAAQPVETPPEPEVIAHHQPEEADAKHEPLDETQKLIIENIASTDYFVFDRAFVDRTEETPAIDIEEATPYEPAVVQQATPPPEEGQVTRYHDDKMPYSFMWWLDKTRNKHSGIYQPFASPVNKPEAAPAPAPVENIPHEVVDTDKKEEKIVERFIQQDPHIKPPTSDKLDNENKAKGSAEDQEELITETLARIYADQMLYSKAIAAYKILMLKNPEKRRYFASQIEILEKKIN